MLSRNVVQITAKLLLTQEIDLSSKLAVSEALEQRDRSVIQFLEILSCYNIIDKILFMFNFTRLFIFA